MPQQKNGQEHHPLGLLPSSIEPQPIRLLVD
jgi:hypothetical protein